MIRIRVTLLSVFDPTKDSYGPTKQGTCHSLVLPFHAGTPTLQEYETRLSSLVVPYLPQSNGPGETHDSVSFLCFCTPQTRGIGSQNKSRELLDIGQGNTVQGTQEQ